MTFRYPLVLAVAAVGCLGLLVAYRFLHRGRAKAAGHSSVSELDGGINITVVRSLPAFGFARVNYATGPASATAGSDYQPVSGTLGFGQGQTRASFFVPVVEDAIAENDEAVILTLSDPASDLGNPAELGKQQTALLTIKNAGNAIEFANDTYSFSETNKFATILVVALPLMLASYHLLVRYSFIGTVLNGRRLRRESTLAITATDSAAT